MYFFSYFIVLLCLIFFVIGSILVMIFLFDVPALTGAPALITLCSIFLLYCPASILFSSSLSYIFDKMDSAQSILPNIVTVTGLIAFFMTWGPDILGFGTLNGIYWDFFSHMMSGFYLINKICFHRWIYFLSAHFFLSIQYGLRAIRCSLLHRESVFNVLH